MWHTGTNRDESICCSPRASGGIDYLNSTPFLLPFHVKSFLPWLWWQDEKTITLSLSTHLSPSVLLCSALISSRAHLGVTGWQWPPAAASSHTSVGCYNSMMKGHSSSSSKRNQSHMSSSAPQLKPAQQLGELTHTRSNAHTHMQRPRHGIRAKDGGWDTSPHAKLPEYNSDLDPHCPRAVVCMCDYWLLFYNSILKSNEFLMCLCFSWWYMCLLFFRRYVSTTKQRSWMR